jgi:hypothetical protein
VKKLSSSFPQLLESDVSHVLSLASSEEFNESSVHYMIKMALHFNDRTYEY